MKKTKEIRVGPKEYDCADMPGEEGQLMQLAGNVEQIVLAMDAKYRRWDIYRSAFGEWVLNAEDGGGPACHQVNAQFVVAIAKALEWVPLPLVPRPPRRLYRNAFVPRKSGSKWRIDYDGQDSGVLCSTKKQVEEFADRQVAQSNFSADIWDSTHGWSVGKTEGVDFRWLE